MNHLNDDDANLYSVAALPASLSRKSRQVPVYQPWEMNSLVGRLLPRSDLIPLRRDHRSTSELGELIALNHSATRALNKGIR